MSSWDSLEDVSSSGNAIQGDSWYALVIPLFESWEWLGGRQSSPELLGRSFIHNI